MALMGYRRTTFAEDAALLRGYAAVVTFFERDGADRRHLAQTCAEVAARYTRLMGHADAPRFTEEQRRIPMLPLEDDASRLAMLRAVVRAIDDN
jgi:hypothetical protein